VSAQPRMNPPCALQALVQMAFAIFFGEEHIPSLSETDLLESHFMFEWIVIMETRSHNRSSTSALFRAFLLCWVSFLVWIGLQPGRAAEVPHWHCDVPALSPDGSRVAYLQWDSALVRIVVVNLDKPDGHCTSIWKRLGRAGQHFLGRRRRSSSCERETETMPLRHFQWTLSRDFR